MIVKCDKVCESCYHRSYMGTSIVCERKCREIRESPSMMWKRSIVQETGGGRRSAALALALASLAVVWGGAGGAELVIEIPGAGGEGEGQGQGGAGPGAGETGHYRLDYRPPHGSPAPNFTVPARASTINFQGLPGTKYHFMLYYSNATFADLLTWNQTIITAPEPPTNLTVALGRNKQATIAWAPPAHGDYTGFRFKVIALTERAEVAERNITVDAGQGQGATGNWTHALRELAPGATYQLHAFTLLHDKESAAYASRNFTTKPNTPGKFIVWFRNETTLLVLWQPPYPPGFYTHYKVSIVPADARDSELYVEKEGEPPGPAQAAFKGLVPGRAYNISVQTVSEPEISAPTTAQYRTVPLRPRNVTAPLHLLSETGFSVAWLPPHKESEFEKYQVSVSGEARRLTPVVRARTDPPLCSFDSLEPGAHYTVTVKTMSGKVTSWPAATELTLRPLPVVGLGAARETAAGAETGAVRVWWRAAEESVQDEYRVEYREAGPASDDASALTAAAPNVTLDALLPGRNYTVSVSAVSRGVRSNATELWVATRPLAPLVRSAEPAQRELRLAWRSDVTSRQDRYELRYRRARAPHSPPGPYRALSTVETHAVLSDLFPGAVYELRLAASSHGLLSENHTLFQPVCPLPATSLSVSRATSNGASVRWQGPPPAAGVISHYALRYRTERAASWLTLPPLPPSATTAEIGNMTHGERYLIELDTYSERAEGDADGVPSRAPLSAAHTVRPNPVSNVAQLVDTRNLTLEWPRGAGRVEHYSLRVWPRDPDAAEGSAGSARELSVEAPAAGAGPARVLLGGLEPGAGYAISIAAHSYNLTSDLFSMETRTRPLILSEMTIVNEADDADGNDGNDTLPSILVTYTPTPMTATRFDSYRFRLEAGEAGHEPHPAQTEPAREAERGAGGTEARRVLFAGLEPGALYNITMWTLSHNVTSHPVQRQARLFPRAVGWLNASRVEARAVWLAWARPGGVYTDFEVQYLAGPDTLQTHVTRAPHLALQDLRPHTLYTFTVVVRSGLAGALRTVSRAVSRAVATAQAAPPAPRAFRPQDVTPARVAFVWDLPAADANGDLTRFLLDYWPIHRPDDITTLHFPPEARSGAVSGLSPGGTYEFALRGETAGGAGAAARVTQHMAIGAPPRPAPSALPAPAQATPTTVSVRFRSDYFSSANGNVTAYTLVVGEEPPALGGGGGGARLPSWQDVQRLSVWPAYQATEPYFPFRASSIEEFTIGSERCEAGARRYCNGPLKPATKYYVKLRAFTAPDKFTDTHYTIVHTEVDNTGWIVGASVALAVALGGAAGALALRRRRARAAGAGGGAGGAGGGAGGAGGGPGGAGAGARCSRPVRVCDFLEHYRTMAADSDFRFSEEFEELKHVGRDQPTSAADLPVNRPKNRFTNILPYDHSRYKLRPVDDEEGSDYINANYVPGHASPREFIVTQGPLHSTRDDFWRMCWESGARGIVMLTRCVEKGREKCDRYWPYDTRPVYYGDIAVTALNESRYPDWTVTELMLSRGSEQRVVKHFHFTTWPDFGVPEPPETLARFVRAFRDRCPPDARPVVVHCSAGVGRSGTFITLDTALQQLARGADALDVFGMVHAMRRERVWMVQTEQQYICIHQCLVAVLEGQDLAPPPERRNHHLNPAFEDDEGIVESGM